MNKERFELKKIGLFFGGRSHEHEVSVNSAMAFLKNVDYSLFEITPFYIHKNGEWTKFKKVIKPVSFMHELSKELHLHLPPLEEIKGIDIAFPLIHGETGEDGKIQGFFEILNIPYVGSDVETSAIGMNKVVAKEIVKNIANINVAPYNILNKSDWKKNKKFEIDFSFPVFVKPSRAGSSIGISKVYDEIELKKAIDKAFLIDEIVIIEKFIDGREIEVGVVGGNKAEVSVPGEITFVSDFYDYDNKYLKDTSTMHIPALLIETQKKEIMNNAKNIYKALGCEGYARVDFFLEKETGKIYFNEINTSPGFTEKSMFPLLFSNNGYEFTDLLSKIILEKLENMWAKDNIGNNEEKIN